jgi:hypothetical protein
MGIINLRPQLNVWSAEFARARAIKQEKTIHNKKIKYNNYNQFPKNII